MHTSEARIELAIKERFVTLMLVTIGMTGDTARSNNDALSSFYD